MDYGEKTNKKLNEKLNKMILEQSDDYRFNEIKDTVSGYEVDLKYMY